MFLKKDTTIIKGKTYSHYKIVESYRQGKEVKQRLISNLGNIAEEQAKKIKTVLKCVSDPHINLVDFDEVEIVQHCSYLDVALLHFLWKKWKFNQLFNDSRWTEVMAINRCIDPLSKINIKDWSVKTSLPAILDNGFEEYDEYDVYRELDRINRLENDIQGFIFQRLTQEKKLCDDVFFYDITSTYFDGSTCIISKHGYSRDNRPDCEQIVIALMVTKDGYPFYWRVLEGNTTDVATVKKLIDDLKSKFGIKNCTLVFDRGMVSEDNIACISSAEFEYVSAMDKDEIRKLSFFKEAIPKVIDKADYDATLEMNEFLPFDEDRLLYCREFCSGSKRYLLSFDLRKYQNDTCAFESKIGRISEWVAEKNQKLASALKSVNQDRTQSEMNAILVKNQANKLVQYHIKPVSRSIPSKKGKSRIVNTFEISFELIAAAVAEEKKMFGITCFISNMSKDKIQPFDIIAQYRSKNKIEEAFHEIKAFTNLRPILLTRPERVRAHVSVCMLSYFLLNDIEIALKSVNKKISVQSLLDILKDCQANRISVEGQNLSGFKITTPTQTQKSLLKSISADKIIENKYVDSIMKKLDNIKV